MTCGIYKITNIINGKSYIGQSVDIDRRWKEHCRSGQPDKYSKKNERDSKTSIHRAMSKYGIKNFKIEVIKECNKELLDYYEQFYIKIFDTYNNGYNETTGGQTNLARKREQHSQAKLTQKQVNDIYSMLMNNKTVNEIQKKYSFISKSTISMINNGKIWKKDKYNYPLSDQKNKGLPGAKSWNTSLTDDIVIEIRKYYVNHSFKEVTQFYNNYTYSLIRSIVYGESWKHLPVYKKKDKKWVYLKK